MKKFISLFPHIQDIFVDATKKRVQRPKDYEKQRKLYSGKEKSYTKNNCS